MRVAIIGTGYIGGLLGAALVRGGQTVAFGSRRPAQAEVPDGAAVASVPDALHGADAVILALPGKAVEAFAAEHGAKLDGALVIDATNQMGNQMGGVSSNARAVLPPGVRYARAFNTLGGENMADPRFGEERADMFYSAPEADRTKVEEIIETVGLRPVYVGADQEELIDALFRLWVALAVGQGRGRRLALRLLEG
jgi:predicted dinucleotide-binding enzyme